MRFIKKNSIIILVISLCLVLTVASAIISNQYAAYLASDEILVLANHKGLPINFGGAIIKQETFRVALNCYEVLREINNNNLLTKINTTDVLHEHIDALLVEAELLQNDQLLTEAINLETDNLWQIVLGQAERNNIEIEAVLKRYQISQIEFTTCLREQAILRIAKKELESTITVSDEDALNHYQNNKNDYIIPQQKEVIMITIDNKEMAQEAWNDIVEGQDFLDVLLKYDDNYALAEKTKRFWVTKGQLVAELDKVIFDMGIGEVRGIVNSSQGYHIIKVEDWVDEQLPEYKEIKNKVIADTRTLNAMLVWEKYITQLRGKTKIVVWH